MKGRTTAIIIDERTPAMMKVRMQARTRERTRD